MDQNFGFRTILEFPGYSINKTGIVRKVDTGKIVKISSVGAASVVLLLDGKQHHRSVRKLRNRAFPELESW